MLNTNGESITNKEKDKKLMMLKFTYEQVLATQAEQVNGKANGRILKLMMIHLIKIVQIDMKYINVFVVSGL